MLENLIRLACMECGLPFHGRVPPFNRWFHFHDDPQRKSGPYFIRLSPIEISGKEKILFVAGDLRLSQPTKIKRIFDGDESLSLGRSDFAETIQAYEQELSKKQTVRHNTAALEAAKIWENSKAEGSCLYMKSKRIDQLYGARIGPYGELVVPLKDIDGFLWGLQRIFDIGKKGKRFLDGMRKRGTFHMIGNPEASEIINVVEGFATGVSVYKAMPKQAVCVAIDAGNMKAIARDLKKKFKGKRIRFCADKDEVGIKSAKAAALAIGAEFIQPEFGFPDHPDYTDFNDLEQFTNQGGNIVREQFQKAEHKKTSFSKQDWIRNYIEENEIEYAYSGLISMGSRLIGYEEFLSLIYLDADIEGISISERMVKSYVNVWTAQRKVHYWNEVVQKIQHFDPSAIEEVKAFLEALTGRSDPTELSVILHFLWQAKRKGFDLPMDHHMMPVIIGASGAGKSEAVKKLLGPIDPIWVVSDLAACSDSRQSNLFEDSLVINMDEMQNAERADMQGLKRTITSSTLTFRIMKTNRHLTVKNRSTLIGTSNNPLDQIIRDVTSIRRFYAIESLPREKLTQNWEVLNRIDYEKLWLAVDPTKPTPLISTLSEVHTMQEDFRAKSDVEHWVEEEGLEKDEQGFESNESLWKRYEAWVKKEGNFGHHMKIMDWVGRDLVRMGFKRKRDSKTRGFKCTFQSSRASDRPTYDK